MRTVLILVCASVSAVIGQNSNDMSNMPKYDQRYDYLDVDAIFTNKRLVRNYVDCLINASRCTPEGKSLKRLLPEALRTKCVRCTERQKRTAVKIIKRLKYEYPDEWAMLSARWDPTGDFTRYFEEFLAKEHFNFIPGSGNVLPLSTGTQGAPSPPMPAPAPSAASAPVPEPASAPAVPDAPPATISTPPRPIVINRFGGDGELMMGSPSSASGTTRPTAPPSTMRISTTRTPIQSRPTQSSFTGPMPATNMFPTRIPVRPSSDVPPPYSTAITFIDEIGYKIIRTTELVTDILKNTVRAVVG